MPTITKNKAVVDKRIDEWKKRLIDLSKRNKFLSWNVNKSNLVIVEPEFEEIFNRLVLQEKKYSFWTPEEIEEEEEVLNDGQLQLIESE